MKKRIGMIKVIVLLCVLMAGIMIPVMNVKAAEPCKDNEHTYEITGAGDDKTLTIYDAATDGYDYYAGCMKDFIEKNGIKKVVLSGGFSRIESGAFEFCNNLTSITILNGVKKIESSAFYDCKNLTSITIPSSVNYIGNNAFQFCNNLTSITIPGSIGYIGKSAIGNCHELRYVVIEELTPITD